MSGCDQTDAGHIWVDPSRVVVLAADHPETRDFVASLPADKLVGVVWELPTRGTRLRLWRRRAQRHGVATTTSRIAALTCDHLIYKLGTKTRDPGTRRPPGIAVPNINDPSAVDVISSWQPSLVTVIGTGLLRSPLLRALDDAVVINVHVGKTPTYRGTHGGAWALIDGRPEEIATTVHLVDEKIDTGQPLVYLPVQPRPTLTALARAQVAAGLDWLSALIGGPARYVPVVADPPESHPLRYPPTFSDWLRYRRAARRIITAEGRQV